MGNKSIIFQYETLLHATAGAAGSIFAMTCLYPLDNIKIRVQSEDVEFKDKRTMEALEHLFKTGGIEGLYRGIKPLITSLGISNFVYFYTFHGLKTTIPKTFQNSSKVDLILSITAGVVNVFLTSPLWVVNSRLKMFKTLQYSGLFEGLVYLVKTEGISSLWSGLGPSLMLVSNPAIHFTIYEALKRRVTTKSALTFFVLGAVSKTISTILTYPIQLAQTQQRLTKHSNVGSFELLKSILKAHGFSGLYQGLETKILQTVLTAALMFMTYEKIAQFVFMLLKSQRKKKLLD